MRGTATYTYRKGISLTRGCDMTSENKIFWTDKDMNTGIYGFRKIVSIYVAETWGTLDVELDEHKGRWFQLKDEYCIPDRCYVTYGGKKYIGLDGLWRLQAVMRREKIAELLEKM